MKPVDSVSSDRRRVDTRSVALSLGGVWLGYVGGAAAGSFAARLPMRYAFDPRFAPPMRLLAVIAAADICRYAAAKAG